MRHNETKESLPPPFLDRLSLILPKEAFDSVISTFSSAAPVTVRVNTLRANASQVTKFLRDSGIDYKLMPWHRGAFVLYGCKASDITETELYKKGKIYIQNLSSLIPALVLDPKVGESVCDLCAAPGSKTTQIACMMKNEGMIIAVDNSRKRFFKLKANLRNQQATAVRACLMDGEAVGRKYPEKFDRILLDAPCSAEGRFRLDDPRTFQYWSPRKIKEMVRKQKRLLIAAYRALKPGGVLVYSTCTFAPEENEGVLSWLIEKTQEAILSDAITLPVINVVPGLTEWKTKRFHPSVSRAVRIVPSLEMEGFFIARLRKKGGQSPGGLSPFLFR